MCMPLSSIFLTESTGEKIVKIGQYLAKIRKSTITYFFAHPVYMLLLWTAVGVFLRMWTQGQVHVLNAGQSVDLDCEFYAEEFSMFNNPVIWKKFQRQEQLEVNIMGNILPPFFSTGRFRVALTTNPPRYRLQLRIAGLFYTVSQKASHYVIVYIFAKN